MRLQTWKLRAWLLEDRALQGLGGAPNMHRYSPMFKSRQHGMSTSVERFGIVFDNDAFDVFIFKDFDDGSESRFAISAEDFRKLALWYLWRWAWGEWFGLRRWLFYWDLARRYPMPRNLAPRDGEEA